MSAADVRAVFNYVSPFQQVAAEWILKHCDLGAGDTDVFRLVVADGL